MKDELAGMNCDICGAPMVVKMGRYGKFYACSRFPECRNTKAIVKDTGIPCPKCGQGTVVEQKRIVCSMVVHVILIVTLFPGISQLDETVQKMVIS